MDVFVPAVESPPGAGDREGWWFAFRQGDLLLADAGDGELLPILTRDPDDHGLTVVRSQYLGTLAGRPCWSAEIDADAETPAGLRFHGLRTLFGRLPETLYAVAGRAAQIVAWDRDHRFCGRCATPTEPVPGERARRCPECGLTAYPRVSPAVIVLIEKGDRILLARGHQFPSGRFGIVAGFVEAGESLEEAVAREVAEEVGLELRDVRYWGSQPWPFPHNLMVGFRAEWAANEIVVDPSELAEAGWYGLEDLPTIPPKLSIARRLIDDWAARRGQTIPEEAWA